MFRSIPRLSCSARGSRKKRIVWVGIKAVELVQRARCGCSLSVSVASSSSGNDVFMVLTSSPSTSIAKPGICRSSAGATRSPLVPDARAIRSCCLPVVEIANQCRTGMNSEVSRMASPSSLGGVFSTSAVQAPEIKAFRLIPRDTYALTGAYTLNRAHHQNDLRATNPAGTCSSVSATTRAAFSSIPYESQLNVFVSTGENSGPGNFASAD